jgi:hypothetical protein
VTASVRNAQGDIVATVADGQWTAPGTPEFARMCQVWSEIARAGRLGYEPDPDLLDAQVVADAIDGEVVGHEPVDHVANRVY